MSEAWCAAGGSGTTRRGLHNDAWVWVVAHATLESFTALHIEERDAHSLGAVVRTITGHALASLRLRRLPG